MEYYVFQTEAEAIACINYINATPWFPIIGECKGQPAVESQATVNWIEEPKEMLSGEWAVDRIPETRLDYVGVPQEDRNTFIAAFGQDIRDLDSTDFPEPEVDEEEIYE